MSAEFAETLAIHRREGDWVSTHFSDGGGLIRPQRFAWCRLSCAKRSPACAESRVRMNTESNRLSIDRLSSETLVLLLSTAVALFAAVTCLALIHRTIFARILATWLVRCERDRANGCR